MCSEVRHDEGWDAFIIAFVNRGDAPKFRDNLTEAFPAKVDAVILIIDV
jgi:hypothetical protein